MNDFPPADPSPSPAPAPAPVVSLDHAAPLDALQRAAQAAVERFIAQWQLEMTGPAARIEQALDSAAQRLDRAGQDMADRRNVVVTLLQAVQAAVDQLPDLPAEDRPLHGWRTSWNEAVESVPETVQLKADRDRWLDDAGDSPAAALWRGGLRLRRPPPPPAGIDSSSDDDPAVAAVRRAISLRAAAVELASEPIEELAESLATAHMALEAERLEALRAAVLDLGDRFSLRAELDRDSAESGAGVGDAAALEPLRSVVVDTRHRVDTLAAEQAEGLIGRLDDAFEPLRDRWPYAGTLLFRLPAVSTAAAKAARSTDSAVDRRRRRLLGLHGNVGKDLRLVTTHIRHAGIASGHADRLRRQADESLRGQFAQINDSVNRALSAAETAPDKTGPLAALKQTGERLRAELRYRRMPAAMNALIEFDIDHALDEYLKNNQSLLASMPETEPVYAGSRGLASPTVQHVPFREIVRQGAFADADSALRALKSEIESERGAIVRGISELDDVLDVNISAGVALVEREPDPEKRREAYDTALKGLDRLRGRVKELDTRAGRFADSAISRFLDSTAAFEAAFIALADNQDLLQLRIKLVKGEMRGRYVRRLQTAAQATAATIRALSQRLPRLLRWGRSEYDRLRRLAGIAPADARAVSRLTVFMQDTERTIAALPYVYQELFRIAPLNDTRFFTGREVQLESLRLVLADWSEGRVASTAVIGEQGSGRTTLLQMANQQVFAEFPPVERTLHGSVLDEAELAAMLAGDLGYDGVDRLDDLEQRIQEDDRRQVCVLENIQHLFLRTVDGFDLIERFLVLVATTGHKVLWILSCTLNSWQYLDSVLAVSGYVHTVIRLDSLNQDTLRGIIDRRHTVSGFKRIYELTEADRSLRRVKRTRSITQRQQVAEDLFFERLHDIAAGNVAVALLFYLRSVVRVKGDTLVFTTGVHLDEEALQGLGTEERFTLAAVVVHDGLTEDEHARVFRQPAAVSRQVLSRLANMGVLVRRDGDYRLHPTLHRPILRALRQVNILH